MARLSDEDRLTLRTAAEAVKGLKWSGGIFWRDGAFPCGPYTRSSEIAERSASFIKHATPERVLALLAEVEALSIGAAAVTANGIEREAEIGELKDRVRRLDQERVRLRKENEDLQLRLVEMRHRVARLRSDERDTRLLAFEIAFTEKEIRDLVANGHADVALAFLRETFLLDLQRLLAGR